MQARAAVLAIASMLVACGDGAAGLDAAPVDAAPAGAAPAGAAPADTWTDAAPDVLPDALTDAAVDADPACPQITGVVRPAEVAPDYLLTGEGVVGF